MTENMRCEELEKLMYLKEDELSGEENRILQEHLLECKACREEYLEISQMLGNAHFQDPVIDSRFLEARVAEKYRKHQDKKPNVRIKPIRRQILKVLSIASVVFFIIYSVEQVNTVRKISELEEKIAAKNGTTIKAQKQVLVLNHFYDRDDFRQFFNPDISDQAFRSSLFPGSGLNGLDISFFNQRSNKLVQEIMGSESYGDSFLNRRFYGNSKLLNLSNDKN